jgi:HK97 family phage prohead protease
MTTATMENHYRSYRPDLEVKAGGDGRTIFGIAVPYNAPTRIHDKLVEEFVRGAFDHQLSAPSRVKVAREHMLLGGTLIGALSNMRDDTAGLYVEMRVSKTPVGEETLELVRDGALNELSVWFEERQNRRAAAGVLQRVKAHLREVAVVLQGAYGELATAAGVRSAGQFAEPMVIDNTEMDLRRKAEEFLSGLPEPVDHDLAMRQLRLGMPVR